MKTPPGISPATFSSALKEFAGIVGDAWVFTDDVDLDLYRDAYSPLRGQAEERVASAAVAPGSVEEVQGIARVANRYGIPIYTISTGKNLGYGGSAPSLSGSVVLDLKRMNRIIEVNDKNHYAIVEPGVSYFDLYDHIRKNKLQVWLDCPDPGWGSLVGNALDHGVGATAGRFRNHFDAHCGMEVVLADGTLVRTGMGALPNSKSWSEFKNGYGPIVDGIFSQSNFGIVTKMGFWLMPPPEAFLEARVFAGRYEDLGPLIEALNYIENSGISTGLPEIASPLLGVPLGYEGLRIMRDGAPAMKEEHKALLAGATTGYSPALEQYGARNGIDYWSMGLTFYGPEKVVSAQWEAAQAVVSRKVPGARFEANPVRNIPLTEAQAESVPMVRLGVPNLETFIIGARTPANPHPTVGHMWFTPVIPRTGEAIIEANRVFGEANRELGLPIGNPDQFVLPFCLFERAFLFVIGFPVFEDVDLNRRIVDGMRKLVRVGAEKGWGEYRAPVIFQDEVMDCYSYNDSSLLRMTEVLKDALDPKGILSPGRYGIWPRHLRGAK